LSSSSSSHDADSHQPDFAPTASSPGWRLNLGWLPESIWISCIDEKFETSALKTTRRW
jgi:hypothetical protein